MANKELNTRLIIAHNTAAIWATITDIPLKGELLLEIDTGKAKWGNGIDQYSDLAYAYNSPSEILAMIEANKYVLPVATASILGGIKQGKNITIAADGTASVADGTTSGKGVVQLTNSTSSTSTTTAATPASVKTAYDKANAALPKSGGTMTGALTLNGDPTDALHATTKDYVDTQITEKLKASDAMVLKGTLGTGGTITAVPTTGVTKGDTYKVITAGTWAGYVCKIGDTLVAMASGSVEATVTNWLMIPSGDERETLIKVASSGVNVDGTARTGTVIFGMAAQKQVASSISGSSNLPTDAAVKAFVEGKGYLTAHPTISKDADSTSTASPGYSGTFTVIDSVERDANGHVTKINEKTVTMPATQTQVQKADQLTNTRLIDGVGFNGTANVNHFTTCSTAAGTAAKTVSLTGFSLVTGAHVQVKFTVTNTAANPTLNVNSTGAKAIFYHGAAISAGHLAQNRLYEFVYDGTNWILLGDINTDTNTDTKVTNTPNATAKAYLTGTTSATTNTGTQVFDTGVYLDTEAGTLSATKFKGALVGNVTGNVTGNVSGSSGSCTGNAATATRLQTARTIDLIGAVEATGVSFNGSENINIQVNSLNATSLNLNDGDTLILNGCF